MSQRRTYRAAALGTVVLVVWALVDLSSLRLAVALAVCLLAPGIGWARKLGLSDTADTLALGVALSMCATTAVATTMALTAHWSGSVGMVALTVIGILGFLPLQQVLATTLRVVGPAPALMSQSDEQTWTDWYDEQRRRSAERRRQELMVAEEVARSWSDWYAGAHASGTKPSPSHEAPR